MMHETQERWDAARGREGLKELECNPERFLVPDNPKLTDKRALVLQEVASPGVQSVVEFGSGQGRFGVVLAKTCGMNVTGIDIGADLVEMANRVAKLNGVEDRCRFVRGSVTNTELTGPFDAVAGLSILHHLNHEGVRTALQEAHRLLKPGGHAVFSEPIENSWLFDFCQNVFPVGKRGTTNFRPSILNRLEWREYFLNRDDRSMTTRELESAAHAAGFEVIRATYMGILSRLNRRFPKRRNLLNRVDHVLLKLPFVRRFAQSVVIVLTKR